LNRQVVVEKLIKDFLPEDVIAWYWLQLNGSAEIFMCAQCVGGSSLLGELIDRLSDGFSFLLGSRLDARDSHLTPGAGVTINGRALLVAIATATLAITLL